MIDSDIPNDSSIKVRTPPSQPRVLDPSLQRRFGLAAEPSEIVQDAGRTSEIVQEDGRTSEVVQEAGRTSEVVQEAGRTSESRERGRSIDLETDDEALLSDGTKEMAVGRPPINRNIQIHNTKKFKGKSIRQCWLFNYNSIWHIIGAVCSR